MVKYTKPMNRPATLAQIQKINAYKAQKAAAFGGDYQKYLESKRSPISPTQQALRELERSSVGDKDYEMDQILQSKYYQDADKKFWLANSEWFHPDGSRKYSDPADQAAWDRLQNKSPAPKSQPAKVEPKIETSTPTPPPQPTFQLPTMMAPPPGQRHLLFNSRTPGSRSQNYMNTAFGRAPATGQTIPTPQAFTRPSLYTAATNSTQQQTGGIPMPSNLNRFYALQNGAQQTPYSHLIDQHAAKINARNGNPAGLNVGGVPFNYQGGGFNAAPPTESAALSGTPETSGMSSVPVMSNSYQGNDSVPMPSNINRFYQLQAGSQQTPYRYLMDAYARSKGRDYSYGSAFNPASSLAGAYGRSANQQNQFFK